MVKPTKPKKPTKAKKAEKCDCRNGKIKEWDYGVYGYSSDYKWVECKVCEGTGVLSPEKIDYLNILKYNKEIEIYNNHLYTYNKLKKIKITEEQIALIKKYGFEYCTILKEKKDVNP